MADGLPKRNKSGFIIIVPSDLSQMDYYRNARTIRDTFPFVKWPSLLRRIDRERSQIFNYTKGSAVLEGESLGYHRSIMRFRQDLSSPEL
jgi:hypothetical protein